MAKVIIVDYTAKKYINFPNGSTHVIQIKPACYVALTGMGGSPSVNVVA